APAAAARLAPRAYGAAAAAVGVVALELGTVGRAAIADAQRLARIGHIGACIRHALPQALAPRTDLQLAAGLAPGAAVGVVGLAVGAVGGPTVGCAARLLGARPQALRGAAAAHAHVLWVAGLAAGAAVGAVGLELGAVRRPPIRQAQRLARVGHIG